MREVERSGFSKDEGWRLNDLKKIILEKQFPNCTRSENSIFLSDWSRLWKRPSASAKALILCLELGTLGSDTFNPDRLIWISNVDTFNLLLNPLFFLFFSPCQFPTNESSLIQCRAKFQISWLHWLAVPVSRLVEF